MTIAPAPYTKEELKAFDKLTLAASSRDQLTRIKARLELQRFEKLHGKEKCNAMFRVLKLKDSE